MTAEHKGANSYTFGDFSRPVSGEPRPRERRGDTPGEVTTPIACTRAQRIHTKLAEDIGGPSDSPKRITVSNSDRARDTQTNLSHTHTREERNIVSMGESEAHTHRCARTGGMGTAGSEGEVGSGSVPPSTGMVVVSTPVDRTEKESP